MGTLAAHDCVYVSPGSGVHEKRWIAALLNVGYRPVHVPRDRYESEYDFRQAVTQAARKSMPAIAGPLDIANALVDVVDQLVFLSWGFDLQRADPNLDLSTFQAVIVDCSTNEAIASAAKAKKIIRMPWGVDLEAIDERSGIMTLAEFGIDDDERVVLSLRAHEPEYRVADIIRAFSRRPRDARLVIGNSGSLTGELRHLAATLGTNAVFLPRVEEEEVPRLLRRASAYVTASEVDGTSVTLLQAMACQVPVVASANAGNVDWIDDGLTGFLFPTADIDALDTAIEYGLVAKDSVVRQARSRVEKCANWESNVKGLSGLLRSSDQHADA